LTGGLFFYKKGGPCMSVKIVTIITADEKDDRQVYYERVDDNNLVIKEVIEGVVKAVNVEREHLNTVSKLMR